MEPATDQSSSKRNSPVPMQDVPRHGPDAGSQAKSDDDLSGHSWLRGSKLAVVLVALCVSNFLVALDTTIIATAIPAISDEFHSLPDVGWYVSAYFLTNCAFQLLFGKLYSLYNIKWVFISAMVIFEIGSLICAVAPTSPVFIFGRAIAGLGGAGTFSGALIIIIHVAPPEKRAAYSGMIVGMFGISSVAGPLIGGALTSQVSWRWCFYINLPPGGVAIAGIIAFFRTPKRTTTTSDAGTGFMAKLAKFDPFGAACLLASVVCLLLALQLGGITYQFSNGRIVALFVLFGVLLTAFIAIQFRWSENATVPPGVLKQRSILSGSFYVFCIGGHFFTLVYFLPIWFQGVRGQSALESGIDTLPILLAQTVCVVTAGVIVSATGHYIPLVWVSVAMTSLGAGLLTTLQVDSSAGKWIGYQIIYGIGGGLGYQQGISAAQTVLGPNEVAMGTALMVFTQNFGGTIFISAANNIFNTKLVANLAEVAPDLDSAQILQTGATGFRKLVSAAELPVVLVAYNQAVMETFKLALILSCLSVIGAAAMEWKRASTKKKETEGDEEMTT